MSAPGAREGRARLRRHRDFRRLWTAQGVSAIGSRVTRTALPVLAVLSVNASPIDLGLLAALSIGPGVLVALATGGLVDRSRKRPILIGADLARAAAVFTLPIAAWSGILTMAQLYLVGAVVGAASALFQIADNAYLPVLLEGEDLVAGNSALEATEAVAEVAGPSLAGLLIQWLTAPIAVLLDAVSYLVSALFLGAIAAPEVPAAVEASPSVWRDIAIGFRASWSHPLVRPLLLATASSTFTGGTFAALYMLYLLDHLSLGTATVGVIISMGGVGSLGGALGSSMLTRRFGLGRALFVFMLLAEASGLLIPLTTGPAWLLLLCLFGHQLVADGLHVAFLVQAVSLRQRALPLEVLGRSNAAFQAITGALLPLGALASGALALAIGVRSALWVGMGAGLVTPLFLLPLWRVTGSGEPDAPAGTGEGEGALDVAQRAFPPPEIP